MQKLRRHRVVFAVDAVPIDTDGKAAFVASDKYRIAVAVILTGAVTACKIIPAYFDTVTNTWFKAPEQIKTITANNQIFEFEPLGGYCGIFVTEMTGAGSVEILYSAR